MQRILVGLGVCFLLWQSWIPAGELADSLPADAAFYAQVDVGRCLQDAIRVLPMIEEKRAANMIFQIGALYESMKELAAHYEMKPKLFDELLSLKAHMVVLAKAKPETEVHTYRMPKWDAETGKRIDGQFTEHQYTTTKRYTVSFVLQTNDAASEDFLLQFKAFLTRQKEKDLQDDAPAWKEVEVERGEMIAVGDRSARMEFDDDGQRTVKRETKYDSQFLGRIGPYIVFSDGRPDELWACLIAAPERILSQTELYRRFTQRDVPPLGLILVGLHGLIASTEKELQDAVAAAKAEAEKKAAPAAEGEFDEAEWKLQSAQSSLASFLKMKEVFSLGALKACGGTTGLLVGEGHAKSESLLTLLTEAQISPALQMILEGGKPLQAPNVGPREGMSFMGHLGAKEIYDEVVNAKTPEVVQGFEAEMAAKKEQVGVNIRDVVGNLAGDIYDVVDSVKREYETEEWNMEKREGETVKKVGPRPELLVLLGVNDPEAVKETLSQAFTKISTAPGLGQFVKKRPYQETEIYLVGANVGKEDANPDGLYSYAAVVLDRYLSFGSWKDMTALVRRVKTAQAAGDDPLAKIIAQHPQASFLFAMPKSFAKKLQDVMKQDDGKDPMAAILETLATKTLPIEDDALEERIRTSLRKLIEEYVPFMEKAQTLGRPYAVVHGQRQERFYEMRTEDEFTKP